MNSGNFEPEEQPDLRTPIQEYSDDELADELKTRFDSFVCVGKVWDSRRRRFDVVYRLKAVAAEALCLIKYVEMQVQGAISADYTKEALENEGE